MSSFSTPAIMLRRTDFGDYDLIITFFTLNKGKISVIAKSAKKSARRFSGILELFSVLDIVCSAGRRPGLSILQEAALKHPFAGIREDVIKTAYASYWAELINEWMEEGGRQNQLYHLFQHVLCELDLGQIPDRALSIQFQIRFIAMSGLCPNLNRCSLCKIKLEKMKKNEVVFDLKKGGLVCEKCAPGSSRQISLSKGTIKQLLWIKSGDLDKVSRIKFSSQALKEGLEFMEMFVPYHLGKEPRSLAFLRQIRQEQGLRGKD
ncbi:MAG: DNA repair protein RecO [Desulfobacteraceae bacterium]|nr:DNA repair protein RecO [Desulfobacteraceae bacterium]